MLNSANWFATKNLIFLRRNHEISIFLDERKPPILAWHNTLIYLFFFDRIQNWVKAKVLGDIKWFLKNHIFHVSLTKEGYLFWKKCFYIFEISSEYKFNTIAVYNATFPNVSKELYNWYYFASAQKLFYKNFLNLELDLLIVT